MQLSELAEASQCVKLPGSVPTDYFSTRYGTSEKAQGDIPLMKLSQLHVLSKLEKMEDCGFHHSIKVVAWGVFRQPQMLNSCEEKYPVPNLNIAMENGHKWTIFSRIYGELLSMKKGDCPVPYMKCPELASWVVIRNPKTKLIH